MAYNLYLNKVAYKNGEGSETDSDRCRHPTHIPWALTIPWGLTGFFLRSQNSWPEGIFYMVFHRVLQAGLKSSFPSGTCLASFLSLPQFPAPLLAFPGIPPPTHPNMLLSPKSSGKPTQEGKLSELGKN